MLEKLKSIRNKKQLLIIITVSVCVVFIAAVFYSNVVKTSDDYKEAVSYYNEYDYKNAKALFEKLGDYKDSKKHAEECNTKLLENDYNHARALYESGDLKGAVELFGDLGDYKDSEAYYEECKNAISDSQIYARIDARYSAYYSIVNDIEKKYGNAAVTKDPHHKGAYTVKGICLLKLIDFNGDGDEELVIGYRKAAKDVGTVRIYAYADGKAKSVYEDKFATRSSAKYRTFDMYNEGTPTLYKGSKSSGYTLVFSKGKFTKDKQWSHKGKTYTFGKKKVSKAKYNSLVPVCDYSQKSPISTRILQSGSFTLYPTSYLTENAANDIKSDVSSTYTVLQASDTRLADNKISD